MLADAAAQPGPPLPVLPGGQARGRRAWPFGGMGGDEFENRSRVPQLRQPHPLVRRLARAPAAVRGHHRREDGQHRRAHRAAHAARRQGPPAGAHGPRARRGRRVQRVPVRHQPSQGDQRPVRTCRGRRGAAGCGRRGAQPALGRRVRLPPLGRRVRLRGGGRCRRGARQDGACRRPALGPREGRSKGDGLLLRHRGGAGERRRRGQRGAHHGRRAHVRAEAPPAHRAQRGACAGGAGAQQRPDRRGRGRVRIRCGLAVRRPGGQHRRLPLRMQHEDGRVPLSAGHGGGVRPAGAGGGRCGGCMGLARASR